jgi:hypothetical protein
MNEYKITISKHFSSEDIIDMISSAIYDIGYWACINNDSEIWKSTSNSLPEDRTFEDVFFTILKNGHAVELLDAEDEDGRWELTMEKLLHGIQLAIDNGNWDGDMDTIDGEVGDIIFQYALFDDIVYG